MATGGISGSPPLWSLTPLTPNRIIEHGGDPRKPAGLGGELPLGVGSVYGSRVGHCSIHAVSALQGELWCRVAVIIWLQPVFHGFERRSLASPYSYSRHHVSASAELYRWQALLPPRARDLPRGLRTSTSV